MFAGMDINCGSFLVRNTESAVEQGKVVEEDIDRALLNLFSVQLRLGIFDGDPRKGKFGKLGPKDVCKSEHRTLALEAARQGIVLLKNEINFLPLLEDVVSSLAVIGPHASNISNMLGTYTGLLMCTYSSCLSDSTLCRLQLVSAFFLEIVVFLITTFMTVQSFSSCSQESLAGQKACSRNFKSMYRWHFMQLVVKTSHVMQVINFLKQFLLQRRPTMLL